MMSRQALPLAIALSLAAPAAAGAQTALGDGGGKAPIEITADNLVVRQQEQLAVFSGNVNAVQGDMTLRAAELRVFYLEDRGPEKDGAKKGKNKNGDKAAQDGGGQQSIRRIEAEGSVVVDSGGQTAKGDNGVYDPATNAVTLDGNVVLTRADNVIRGGHLVLDLDTGVATLKPAGGGQRVRALFQPEAGTDQAQAKQER
ncbi:LptA/OstA family protein [Geminicoccaceae bacterium 1502E]|nr:LptA/OstA family protein [Geminicoccaceae bacterium 1502E]